MLTTQEKHNPGCERVARLEGQSSTGFDKERAVKLNTFALMQQKDFI